jgi:hypothetical protein
MHKSIELYSFWEQPISLLFFTVPLAPYFAASSLIPHLWCA